MFEVSRGMTRLPKGVYERTEEYRRKLSLSYKGKPASFKGRKHSLESRAKMSERVKKAFEEGRWIPWSTGRTFTAEHRKHMSESRKLRYETHTSPLKGRKTDRSVVERQTQGRLKYYETNQVWNKNRKHSQATHERYHEL